MKPLFKVLIAVAIVALLAVAGYFAWDLFMNQSSQQPSGNTDGTGADLPIAPVDQGTPTQVTPGTGTPVSPQDQPTDQGTLSPKRLSDSPVFFAWEASTLNDVLYITPNGRVLSAREGPDTALNTQTFAALNRVEPSQDGSRLLASFGDPRNPEWRIFDVLDRSWRPLQSGLVYATWGRGLSDIVAIARNTGKTSLIRLDTSNAVGASTTLLASFPFLDATVTALSSTTLLITERPSALVEGRVWQLNTRTGALSAVLSPAAGRTVGVTPDREVIFSFSSPDQFTVFNGSFQELVPLPFWTLPEKCGGTSRSVYCFVPIRVPTNPRPVLPDEYLSRAFHSTDALYRIDLSSGATARLSMAQGTWAFDGTNVFVSGMALYFVDATDGGLYLSTLQ